MKKLLLLAFLFCCTGILQTLHAKIKIPAIVSSNMVLQRNTTVTIWGWADANEIITIKTSWTKKTLNLKADATGNWSIDIETTNSKEPQTMNLKSNTSNIDLKNILFGEVWLCSGQSNMEQPLEGFAGQPTYGSTLALTKSTNPNLRLFTVHKQGNKTPLNDIEKYTSWEQASPNSVLNFSAVAYFFGQQLQEVLDVPVGLIHTSFGGSSVQAWMSNEAISPIQIVNLADADLSKKLNSIPTVLFNAMINPLVKYKIKGALWYQGESNRGQPEKYKDLFPAMVKDWRQRWNIGDFPFYYVQIAPYSYDKPDAFQKNDNSAFIRETQLACLDLIPNSGIVITLDIGDENTIHPPKKKEVADRLLFNALQKTYGYKNIESNSPFYESMKVDNGGIILKFKNATKGIYAYGTIEGLEIAGEDKVFYPATGKIVDRKNVFVKSDKVTSPVAVRYAWKNWVVGTLYNTFLLPAPSFRTDDWTDATQAPK